MLETHKPTPLLITKNPPLTSLLLPTTSSSSAEDYHGGSPAAVPFTWESQPGTPKVRFRRRDVDPSLPPLTPPPSYFYSPSPNHHYNIATNKRFPSPSHANNNNKKKNLLHTLFFASRRSCNNNSNKYSKAATSSPLYSSSSSSSTSSSTPSQLSVPSSPINASWSSKTNDRSGHVAASCSPRKSFADMLLTTGNRHEDESPVSTLCFGMGRGPTNPRARPGCYGSFIKVLVH